MEEADFDSVGKGDLLKRNGDDPNSCFPIVQILSKDDRSGTLRLIDNRSGEVDNLLKREFNSMRFYFIR